MSFPHWRLHTDVEPAWLGDWNYTAVDVTICCCGEAMVIMYIYEKCWNGDTLPYWKYLTKIPFPVIVLRGFYVSVYTSLLAFFNTLQVVFWRCSPKALDFTGYSMLLLLCAFFRQMLIRCSQFCLTSDKAQHHSSPRSWICRPMLKMHVTESFCLPVVSALDTDSMFSTCQSGTDVVPLFSFPHISQLLHF